MWPFKKHKTITEIIEAALNNIKPELKEGDRVVVHFAVSSMFGKVISEPYMNTAPFSVNDWYVIVEGEDGNKQPCWCKLIHKY